MFGTHRQTDAERPLQAVGLGQKAVSLLRQPQVGRAETEEPHHKCRRHQLGKPRAQRRSHHAQSGTRQGKREAEALPLMGGEDEEEIEYHVQHTHQYVQQAGHEHIAAASQHAAAQEAKLESRKGHGEYQKVERSIVRNGSIASQPHGQHATNATPHGKQQEAEQQCRHNRLAQHCPCPLPVSGTDAVRHLYGEARGNRGADTPEQPSGGGYQSNGSGSVGSQAAHHRSVNILHDDGGHLRHNGRHT